MRAHLSIACLLLAASCGTPPKPQPSAEVRPSELPPVPRILQFYAAPSVASPGQPATLCYGVENAATVKLHPPVENLKPAFSRCFPVSPNRNTSYTLTAERDGLAVSRTVEVGFSASPPPPTSDAANPPAGASGPAVLAFTASPAEAVAGQAVMLCFQADSDALELQPGDVKLGGARVGCYSVAPKQTTEYTLIAHRGARTARQSVTIRVK
ncbi:MAG: hypothetical protein ACKV22_07225 [Bryobacteraceae bacterium]